MSLVTKIKNKLVNITNAKLHSIFACTVLYNCSGYPTIKQANAAFANCYEFDGEFTASAYRMWSETKYTMVNLRFFVLWLKDNKKCRTTTLFKAADLYGVSKADALLVQELVDVRLVPKTDGDYSRQAMDKALTDMQRVMDLVIVALRKSVNKSCQWIMRSSNVTSHDIVSDILGEIVSIYYSILPTTMSEQHIQMYMYSAVSSRVNNYLNRASAGKRKRSIQIVHKDGSVDYEYIERNETQLSSNMEDDDLCFLEDFLAEDVSDCRKLSEFEHLRTKQKLLRTSGSKNNNYLYRLLFGEHLPEFYQFLIKRRYTRSQHMTCCDWILSVPFHKFVTAYSEFANVSEKDISNGISRLKSEVVYA